MFGCVALDTEPIGNANSASAFLALARATGGPAIEAMARKNPKLVVLKLEDVRLDFEKGHTVVDRPSAVFIEQSPVDEHGNVSSAPASASSLYGFSNALAEVVLSGRVFDTEVGRLPFEFAASYRCNRAANKTNDGPSYTTTTTTSFILQRPPQDLPAANCWYRRAPRRPPATSIGIAIRALTYHVRPSAIRYEIFRKLQASWNIQRQAALCFV